ncbi:hypothetical protein BWZ20_02245 [Winogradskyella sp. J14-2]|uniref:alpha/beta fold hydrolase n=1 Tax=Winogradskyella sp. J14-2 TaxID=1936080 RepID=UPI000972C338|nr:hypothetical protein [Winogradskyella sp. J14-2]APY07195.1 hypothetical protein BWZ20_02245 [Winogradskyella sp. J14-2]
MKVMQRTVNTFLILFYISVKAQISPEDFGFRHFQYVMENDTLEVLIKSKKGEEHIKKPLLFSIQGSRAIPLIIHNGTQRTFATSIEEGFFEDDYHIVIVNKPGVPLISHKDSLDRRREYFIDKKTKTHPKAYIENNNLEYYVKTNKFIVEKLLKESWVDPSRLVVSGHSQGSSIALGMADEIPQVTHLIYSSGLPYYSTILSIIARKRMHGGSKADIEEDFEYWKAIVNDPLSVSNEGRDSYRMMSSFSINENEILKRLNIPVLISYGTKDESSPYHDMFRVECIKDSISHITWNVYQDLGHNYQLQKETTTENEKTDYLPVVVTDWISWLKEN